MSQKKELIKYLKSLGLDINTRTKARGHQGFCLSQRIDVSASLPEDRVIPVLLHEFSHYIHSKIEPNIAKSAGSIEKLFCANSSETPILTEELTAVTKFVDELSRCERFFDKKNKLKAKIKGFEQIIKADFPKFQRSKKFKEFDKYIKKTDAKYLLKYDRVRLRHWFFDREKILAVDSVEQDFPDMPRAFVAYIKLHSTQKKQARISARINKLNKYYAKPTELFARFVECVYTDEARAQALAPHTTKRFYELLGNGYYLELKTALEIAKKNSLAV